MKTQEKQSEDLVRKTVVEIMQPFWDRTTELVDKLVSCYDKASIDASPSSSIERSISARLDCLKNHLAGMAKHEEERDEVIVSFIAATSWKLGKK